MAISDPTLFVECDRCDERIDFDFTAILNSNDWKNDDRFDGWWIDWTGIQGDALCPTCRNTTP